MYDDFPRLRSQPCQMCGEVEQLRLQFCDGTACVVSAQFHQHVTCGTCHYAWVERVWDPLQRRTTLKLAAEIRKADVGSDDLVLWLVLGALARRLVGAGPLQITAAELEDVRASGDALLVQLENGNWQIFLDDEAAVLDDGDEDDDDEEFWESGNNNI